jgi:hypothetical protein
MARDADDSTPEFRQLIGTRFHEDAFDGEFETVDEILDDYLGDGRPPAYAEAASRGGHRLLSAGHDEQELGAILRDMGFAFVPELLGHEGHRGLVTHVLARLDRAIIRAR